jgi:hypothetical protein
MVLRRLVSISLLGLGALILYGCGGGGAGTGGAAGDGATAGAGGSTGTGGGAGTSGVAGSGATAGTTGAAGTTGIAGTTGAAGRGGSGGTTGAGGTGTGGMPATASLCAWPTPASDVMVNATITITGVYDGTMRRFIGAGNLGTSGQSESQDPIFHVVEGATLANVIIGNPAADGVHCDGNCTLKNVWWEDVGEDAATLKGTNANQVMTIDGGGAQKASDKIFQHNGPGTMIIRNFCAQDFGKLYRSCGNCDTQYARHVQLENVLVVPGSSTSALVGVNSNYNDTAKFSSILIKAASNSLTVCQRYTGNNTGAEPPKNGSGADGTVCVYAPSDITWMP